MLLKKDGDSVKITRWLSQVIAENAHLTAEMGEPKLCVREELGGVIAYSGPKSNTTCLENALSLKILNKHMGSEYQDGMGLVQWQERCQIKMRCDVYWCGPWGPFGETRL
jgi:hypothetical protein